VADDGKLQRRHDFLAIVDGQTNGAVEQALLALVDADLLAAGVAKFVPALDCDRPFHRCRYLPGQSDVGGLFAPNNPSPTPEKLPVSINIPQELDEAALVDGCSRYEAFPREIMPVMGPGVVTAGLFAFLLAYNDFLISSQLMNEEMATITVALGNYMGQKSTSKNDARDRRHRVGGYSDRRFDPAVAEAHRRRNDRGRREGMRNGLPP
jgi:hypothetical protein